jgi:hypothetical protein
VWISARPKARAFHYSSIRFCDATGNTDVRPYMIQYSHVFLGRFRLSLVHFLPLQCALRRQNNLADTVMVGLSRRPYTVWSPFWVHIVVLLVPALVMGCAVKLPNRSANYPSDGPISGALTYRRLSISQHWLRQRRLPHHRHDTLWCSSLSSGVGFELWWRDLWCSNYVFPFTVKPQRLCVLHCLP